METENNNLPNNEFEGENEAADTTQSYTPDAADISEAGDIQGADTADTVSDMSEPTVLFDSPIGESEPEKKQSSVGIKVFFALIAVVAMLVLAVTAGFIYGKKYVYGRPSSTDTVSRTHSVVKYAGQTEDSVSVYEKAAPSVVGITVYNSDGPQAYASGVIYYEDGYIVTNDHIYLNIEAPKFIVTLYDGTEYDAEFVAGDTRSDLAVLKVDAKGLKPAEFASSSQIKNGEFVYAVGYPGGKKGLPAISEGVVSATDVRITTTSSYSLKMIQSSVVISSGSSGGALFNSSSQVVGITNARSNESDCIAFSIPSDTVLWIADELIKNGCVTNRGRLGITYIAIDSVTAKINGTIPGLKIKSVSNDSELYGKNISKDDIITHINDVKITSSDVALDIIESFRPGEALTFTVCHTNGKTDTVIAALIPDEGSSSYSEKITNGNTDFFSDNGTGFYSDHQ